MASYFSEDTSFDGPQPIVNPPSDPVTVSISARTSAGSILTRSVRVQRDTKISSLIEQVTSVQDNTPFPDLLIGFCPPNVSQTAENMIAPRAVKTTRRYQTFDVAVTDQPSTWAPPTSSTDPPPDIISPPAYTSPNLINLQDPFIKLWTRLTSPTNDCIARFIPASNSISYQGMNVSLKRTVRVPNDGVSHPLPAGLGSFSLVNVARYSNNLPEYIRQKGGLLVPMYHAEAMWVAFQNDSGTPRIKRKIAIRMYVGGVNGISGEASQGMQRLLAGDPGYVPDPFPADQDYMVMPGQMWVDGIVTGDREVRQFVATPLNSGTTVESQLTGRDSVGGLQLEFIPSYDTDCSVRYANKDCDQFSTPSAEGLLIGSVIQLRGPPKVEVTEPDYTVADYQEFFGSHDPTLKLQVSELRVLYIKTLTGKTIMLVVKELRGVTGFQLKKMIEDKENQPPDMQRLIFNSKQIEDHLTLEHYGITYESILYLVLRLRGGYRPPFGPQAMGIGAGGRIRQTINKDNSDRRIWDLEASSVINIQILNALDFAGITNLRPHETPITREMYTSMGLPWFEIYDQDIQAINNPQGPSRFRNLISLQPESLPVDSSSTDILLLALGRAVLDRRNVITSRHSLQNGAYKAPPGPPQWQPQWNNGPPIPYGPGYYPPPQQWHNQNPYQPPPMTYGPPPPQLPPAQPPFTPPGFGPPLYGGNFAPGPGPSFGQYPNYPVPGPSNGPYQNYYGPMGSNGPMGPGSYGMYSNGRKPSKLARIFSVLME